MRCDRVEELSAWMDGELNETARAEFESHLADCPACRQAREEMSEIRAEIRRIDPGVDPDVQRKTLAGILALRPEPIWRRRLAVPVPVLAGLAVVFLSMAALLVAGRTGSEAPNPAPVTVARAAAPAGKAGTVDLSRFDRGGRAVIYKAPRSATEPGETAP